MKKFSFGPATLVAAAFIGPGTVTVCTLAGSNYGFTLLWALLFSIATTIILQEMAARLGFFTKSGLGQVLRKELQHPWVRIFGIVLVLSAIVIGNAAYEAGNISGAVLGASPLFGEIFNRQWICISIAAIAFVILYIGKYKWIERSMVALVIVMSLCFLVTAILTKPDISSIIKGLFIPRIDNSNLLIIMALIGTTVVPYNLFLHASLVNEKWKNTDIKSIRKDTFLSIILGGIISMAVLVCAGATQGQAIESAQDMARGLEPLLGKFAITTISTGLFAAGITSAITAPLAAAYAATGILGLKNNTRSRSFRLIWMLILFSGLFFSLQKINPVQIIHFAQIANAILLPLIATFLIWVVNRRSSMNEYVNKTWQNALGIMVVAITIALSVKSFLLIF
ncbi:MAG TPA: Nramp family divalent metal transporter [Saprospiraceae bacterium]|nr:Nramp family divalent metal transporter [Saprospiraceae bacterium]